jgi:hypothetical protein
MASLPIPLGDAVPFPAPPMSPEGAAVFPLWFPDGADPCDTSPEDAVLSDCEDVVVLVHPAIKIPATRIADAITTSTLFVFMKCLRFQCRFQVIYPDTRVTGPGQEP